MQKIVTDVTCTSIVGSGSTAAYLDLFNIVLEWEPSDTFEAPEKSREYRTPSPFAQ